MSRDGRSVRWPLVAVWSALFVAAAVIPPAALSEGRLSALASGLYLALAAVGLNFAVGLSGLPSLGQGAFMGAGAFGAAWLRLHAGWDPVAAAIGGTALAVVLGAITAAGVARLRPAFLAISTWVLSWLLVVTLSAFPAISGGSSGLALPEGILTLEAIDRQVRFTPGVHFAVALVLLALALVAYARASRSPAGVALTAVRQAPSAAAALGLRAGRLREGALLVSATIAGVAGALSVQLAGVADPAAYGPLRSAELLIAVLLGGTGTVLGPVLGAAMLAAIPPLAEALGDAVGLDPVRFEPVVVAALLLVAVLLGGRGILRRRRRAPEAPDPTVLRIGLPGGGAILEAHEVSRSFGGVQAIDGVSFDVRPGEVHAIIGPNGSGKSTLLRVLSGALAPHDGRVALAGRDVTSLDVRERVIAGVVRTLQRTAVAEDLTGLEHITVGATVRRRIGALAALGATPSARAEERAVLSVAGGILHTIGLAHVADDPVALLTATQLRLLMLGTALASVPRAILVDEPSSGIPPVEIEWVLAALDALRLQGLGLVVVEHNVSVVRQIADRVTVLDAGRVVATGAPEEVVRDPLVQEAYLGSGPEAVG